MVDSQAVDKLEVLATENRRLKDENTRLSSANKHLAAQLIERNDLVVALELEARAAKKARRKR